MLAADKRGKRSLDELKDGMSREFGKYLIAIEKDYQNYMAPFHGKPDGSLESVAEDGILHDIHDQLLPAVCVLIYSCLGRPELEKALDVAEKFIEEVKYTAEGYSSAFLIEDLPKVVENLGPKAEDFPTVDTKELKHWMYATLNGIFLWTCYTILGEKGHQGNDERKAFVKNLPEVVENCVALITKGLLVLIQDYRLKSQEQSLEGRKEESLSVQKSEAEGSENELTSDSKKDKNWCASITESSGVRGGLAVRSVGRSREDGKGISSREGSPNGKDRGTL